MSRRTAAALFVLMALAAVFAACSGGQTDSPPSGKPNARPTIVRTPTPIAATPEEAVRQLINAECEAVVQQDIDRLQGIWAADGVIVDANHTPTNAGDDVTWKTWDAIRDRYVNIVFPSSPTFCEHPNVQVNVTDASSATARTGVKIGATNCTDCNQWVFKKTNDGWRISAMTYNLNAQK